MVTTHTTAVTQVGAAGRRQGTRSAAGIGAALAVLVAVLVTAFAYPAARSGPHQVPLGLVAPDQVAARLDAALDAHAPGGFDVTRYADAAAARAAVGHHDVDGALVLGGARPQVVVASAASPAVAQLLTEVADTAATQLGGSSAGTSAGTVETVDVVAAPAGDPRGAVLAAGVLPGVIASMVVGLVAALVVRGARRRLVTVAVAAAGAGLLVALVLGPWLGALPGAYWAVAGIVALGVAGCALLVTGLAAVLGRAGLVLGALLVLLVGNPSSAAAAAPELLPTAWGVVGPWLPPGAMVEALRAATFFDGAHAARPVLVLVGWVVVLGALTLVGRREAASTRPAAAGERALLPSAV